jgi:hypothetical protein
MSTALITITPEIQELLIFAQTFLGTAQAIRITSPDEAQAAVDQTRAIKDCGKTVVAVRKTYTDPLDEQRQYWTDLFRPAADVLVKAEALLKGTLVTWDAEQRRLAAIAAEEQRQAAKAEQDRLAEEQRQAEALLAQADEAAASGDVVAAAALEEQAAVIQTSAVYSPAPVVIAAEKPKGASSRMKWRARVVNAALVPDNYKTINQPALDAYAGAMKEAAAVSGVEFFAEAVISIK